MTTELTDQGRRFYLIMAVISALVIFIGFAPSYYLKGVLHAPPPLSALTVVHGLVFTAWMLLFVLQSALIGYGRPSLHRRLGVLGAVLFGAVVTLGLSTAITAGRLGHAPPESPAPLAFMALPVLGLTGAAALVLLALAYRSRSDFHKRLMLASFIFMTPPAIHRLAIGAGQAAGGAWIALFVADLLLGCAIVYDLVVHKRVHPAYLWSAAVFVAVEAGVAWAFSSEHWLVFAGWLTRGG